MTDRVDSLVVVLDRDMRDDDVEHLMKAIRMLRFVADVSHRVVDQDAYVAREWVRSQLRERLYTALDGAFRE